MVDPVYEPHQLKPEDFLRFVETDEFRDDWEKLGFDVENDLWALQNAIMRSPAKAPMIRGAGGLRKLRFARKEENVGKRSGVRVCYAYFERHRTVLLVIAYGKTRKDELSLKERRGVAHYLAEVERNLDRRSN